MSDDEIIDAVVAATLGRRSPWADIHQVVIGLIGNGWVPEGRDVSADEYTFLRVALQRLTKEKRLRRLNRSRVDRSRRTTEPLWAVPRVHDEWRGASPVVALTQTTQGHAIRRL